MDTLYAHYGMDLETIFAGLVLFCSAIAMLRNMLTVCRGCAITASLSPLPSQLISNIGCPYPEQRDNARTEPREMP